MSTDEFDVTVSDAFRTPGRRRNNFAATVSPTANDDSGDGYEVGSRWIDVTANEAWECVDSTLTAAIWIQGGSGSGGGDLTSLFIDLTVSGAHTADRDDGATHDLTLVGNTTLTPVATTIITGETIDLRLLIRQDGTGSRTLGWGGSIDWATHDGNPPDMPTAANAMLTVGLLSVDDGVSWIGYAGGSSALATTVTDETTYGIAPAVGTGTKSARDDHTHGTPAEPEAPTVHFHIVSEPQVGDGATTVFYLANEAESDTVAAYVNGVRTDVTQSTTEPDKITFGAAPGAAATLRYDYIPVTT